MSFLSDKLHRLISHKSSEWLETTAAYVGNVQGIVDTGIPGVIWAKFPNGTPIKVYNGIGVPDIPDTKIKIGRSKTQPNFWQVIEARESYLNPSTNGFLRSHAKQHMFGMYDQLWVDRRQVMYMTAYIRNATESAEFKVFVIGGLSRSQGGNLLVVNQLFDLSAYVPTEGAVYVAVETDANGVLFHNPGVPFGSPTVATVDDMPQPISGRHTIAYVLLFETMTGITNDLIRVPVPLMTDYFGMALAEQIHAANEETELQDDDEVGYWQSATEQAAKIKWSNLVIQLTSLLIVQLTPFFDDRYAGVGHEHSIARWNGASGQTNFDLPEYWEYIKQVFVDGICQDPFDYSLSAERDQIIFDTGLPADMIVVADGVIAQV